MGVCIRVDTPILLEPRRHCPLRDLSKFPENVKYVFNPYIKPENVKYVFNAVLNGARHMESTV